MGNALNLQEVDQEQALSLCKFTIQSQGNVCFLGRRGTGKTHIAMQATKENNLKLNYLNLATLERSDVVGLPLLHDDGDVVKYKAPYYLPPLKENQKADTVILFDEVDKAPPEVTAPLLEILQFRTVNGQPINAISCILTGNLSNEGAYSNAISTAILDRTSKYILSFSFEKWMDWARVNQIHDLILGFLKSNSDLACGKVNDISYASPSPRGWSLASEALIKARLAKIVDIETITNIISGFVGQEAGIKFKIWYEHYRKFEPFINSIIDSGEMSLDFTSLPPTEKLVFVISLCHLTKIKVIQESVKKSNKNKYLDNLCNFLIKSKVDKEVQVIALYNSFSFEMITKYKLYECKKFFELFTKLNENINIKK
jgi:hypothetical protein